MGRLPVRLNRTNRKSDMTDPIPTDPTLACEATLRAERQYNEDHEIWPSENAVINRLLARQLEMIRAYCEIHEKLGTNPPAFREFWRVVATTAALWNPVRNAEARAGRERLVAVNREIAAKAADLAALFDERSELHNSSGFSAPTLYSVFRVIDATAEKNLLYRMYLRDSLRDLNVQFDLKYWPTLGEFMQVLSSDADTAVPEATDPLTEAATRASRASKADFFKALFVALEENRVREQGFLPNSFKLTDETMASLGTCALDLGADEIVDGGYVKRLRQRERTWLSEREPM